MPVISMFYGIIIQMFWNDHPPPHFHVRYAEAKATIEIESLSILTGSLPKIAERLVMQWAMEHQEELREDWELCRRQAQPQKISPLR